MMDEVFEAHGETLSDAYLDALLARDSFWAMVAVDNREVIGGLTAHTLPMTRAESAELFVFDVAVSVGRQREGIGRQLLHELRAGATRAGIGDIFVAADNEDAHALDFYHATGGEAMPVTMFTFSAAPTAPRTD